MSLLIGYDDNCPNNYTPRRPEAFDGPYSDSQEAWAAYGRLTATDCRARYGEPVDATRFGWCVTLYVGNDETRHVAACKTIKATD